jgi:UDP-N-acetylglucosamine--dolichyl-phosphate N-acetylglucosaminephosphotransferase
MLPDASLATALIPVFAISFAVTFLATPKIGKMTRAHGIVGVDVHKISKTVLPETCGLAILIGLSVGVLVYAVIFPGVATMAAAFVGTILIAGAIGFVDDLHHLNAKIKPLLTAVACVPILLLRTYDSFAVIPFIGVVRLTIIYPILIPIALAVTSNAVNMMDVMNGAMPGTVSLICGAAAVVLLASGKAQAAVFDAALLATLLAFYYYNRFPAKVFDGDTGSLPVGAALGALAVMGKIEVVLIVALIPHIMNAFYGLASVGRLYERREITQRPTRLLANGELEASDDRRAPITLTRLILAAGPLGEKEIVREMMLLTLVSSILAIVTYGLTLVGRV